ncbi:MAG TPA: beta-ketoacyl-ACP synthase 3 [Solirubrobacteraceae bacterium]|jgi:3-oxoacyl-[acyl-carrier-protein] synthase-3
MPPELRMGHTLQTADLTLDHAWSSQRSAGIVGLGTALPERKVANAELAQALGLSDGWIERRTGIVERRYAAPGERVVDLAQRAAEVALLDAELDPQELDLVLVATLAADEITPGTAPLLAHALGCVHAAAIDIGAACAGSLAALALGSAWIEAGRASNALVVGAEILSRFVNMEDRRTAHLFGDGAGALVLRAGGAGRIGPILLDSDGAGAGLIHATREQALLEMDGHETFLQAVHQLHVSTMSVLERAGLALQDVDLFVYHQANSRILGAVADRLGVSRGRVLDCIAQTGNTSAASVPLALAHARENGLLQPGMRIVIGAVGAGLTWGAAVVEWNA